MSTANSVIKNKLKVSSLDYFLNQKDENYWSFRGRAKRDHCHSLIKYPAMMVPQMQGELIDFFLEQDKGIKSVFDPFVGSGTVLVETMTRGLDFLGIDINPLAIMACETKSGPFFLNALNLKWASLEENITSDTSFNIDYTFDEANKWFLPDVQLELCKIRRNIKKIKPKWARRFFWVAFSDVVRMTCNSRPTTYKLHIKDDSKIEEVGSPVELFIKKCSKNLIALQSHNNILEEENCIKSGRYQNRIDLLNVDVINSKNMLKKHKFDLLVSSPPYGDNGTTVTYGQYSYLPLKWIDAKDFPTSAANQILENSNRIDFLSLGGSKKGWAGRAEKISEHSASFREIYNEIPVDSSGRERLTSFFADLNLALDVILERLQNNAYMIWTLGNRSVSGVEIQLDLIFQELLESKGCGFEKIIHRDIPSKRMPGRNKTSKTMTKETVLIMRNRSL